MQDDSTETKQFDWVPLASLALAVLVGLLLYFKGGDPKANLQILEVLAGYAALILIFFFGFMILVDMVRGRINLSKLIAEKDGSASMSRFQLLIFTFVIALSLLLLVASDAKFPAIPNEVLILLGISASTYGVSKGIQKSAEMAQPPQHPAPEEPAPAGEKTKAQAAS